jgi:catalase
MNKTHGHFIGQAVSFLSQIRPEDFKAPRALWQKVFDEPARERFIHNVSGKMELCKDKETLKPQIAIFREVNNDIATRLKKATSIKGYDGIANLKFNGTHNGIAKDAKNRWANGISQPQRFTESNGAPFAGTHAAVVVDGIDGIPRR